MKPAKLVMILASVAMGGLCMLAADAPGGYPTAVQKKLYGEDFRGKKMPELVVQKWLTKQPDTKGKVVLIDFWATWCPPCRETIPELNQLQKDFKDDLVVIGISAEKEDVVTEFQKKTEMTYSQALDPEQKTHKAIKVEGIPHVVILSTDGIVRWQGYPLSAEKRLTAAIVKRIIDADPGVAERRAKEKAK